MDSDSVYKNWNLATIESIEHQIDSTADKFDKAPYLNRISLYKEFLQDEKNRNIISRYTFLSKLFSENKGNGDFYVIETTGESGSRVITWNFILRKIKRGKYQVEMYDHNTREWQKYPKTFHVNFNFPEKLSDYTVKSGNGTNQNDVIISYVNASGQVKSDFILYNKLSKESGLEKILELR